MWRVFFFEALQSQFSLRQLFFRFLDHTDMSHTPGRTSLSEWPVRRRCRYPHNTHQTQEKNIHAFSEMRTHDPRSHGAADLRLRPHGHRDRLCGALETVSQVSANMSPREPCCAREFEYNSIHHAFIVCYWSQNTWWYPLHSTVSLFSAKEFQT